MKINQRIQKLLFATLDMSFLCHNDVIMGSNWENGVIMSELNAKTFFWYFP